MTDMIGRAPEAAAIAQFVERVPDGPVGLLIEGDPGIGKTTVMREAIRAAQDRGYRVLHARPAQAEADLSFTALGDLVGEIYGEVSHALPPPQRQALDVALLLQQAGGPADPRTTAGALLSVVTKLSSTDPLVIAIDDAHWLDRATLRALEFTIRRLPRRVGIVVARRSEVDSAQTLDLERALGPDRVGHLLLAPLSVATLHHLVESRHRLKLPRPILVRIAEASGGNPFYALEIAGAMARGRSLPGLSDLLPMPHTLQGLLGDRVDRLSAAAREIASAAAALSRPTVDVLEAALGSEIDVDAALLEAEDAGILVSDGDRLRFSHPLLASTLYGSLTARRRRALHRRLAVVAGDLEERARHLARSTDAGDDAAARIHLPLR